MQHLYLCVEVRGVGACDETQEYDYALKASRKYMYLGLMSVTRLEERTIFLVEYDCPFKRRLGAVITQCKEFAWNASKSMDIPGSESESFKRQVDVYFAKTWSGFSDSDGNVYGF